MKIAMQGGGESYNDYGNPEIISRRDWGAHDSRDREPLPGTPTFVIISHSVTGQAYNRETGIALMKEIQNFHMDHLGWSDIAYSFVIGGDGTVYEGRGWDRVGAHTRGFNRTGLGFCLIGNFNNEAPTPAQINATKGLIGFGLEHGHIATDFGLRGHRDCSNTDSPGEKAYLEIQGWPRWNKDPDAN